MTTEQALERKAHDSDNATDAKHQGAIGAKETFSVEVITPDDAKKLLETAVLPFEDKKAVETYARAMEAGSWIMNGQPIILNEEGRLIDGVQRLAACIEADVSFTTVVARNVRSDILHTIDQHRRRNYQGVLDSRGFKDTAALVRTASRLIRIENGVLGKETMSISWSRYDRVLEANPELTEAIEISNKFHRCSMHSNPRPSLIFMAIRAGKKEQVISFLQQLTDHWNEPLDSPARVFNLELGSWAANRKRGATRQKTMPNQLVDMMLGHAILYFNAYCKGEKLNSTLTWIPDYGTRMVNKVIDGEERAVKEKGSELKFDRNAAPANLGMPVVDGYPGLREGNVDRSRLSEDLVGATADLVHQGAASGAGKASVRMMLITPELAASWLDPRINRGNRKTQINHVKAIARDIKNGNWMMNAQPICFTKDPMKPHKPGDEPRLLNGQHRLLAIRDAGVAVEIPIAVNIPEEAFATFDVHAKRTLRRSGPRGDDRVMTAAARFQYKEDNKIPLSSSDMPTLTSSELLEVVKKHPGLQESFPLSRKAGMVAIGSAGVMTYFIYRVRRENPELAEGFLDKIETGLNIKDANDPAGKLRSELANKQRGNGGLTRKELIESLMSHWNSYKRWAVRKQNVANKEEEPEEELQDNLFE